jgi:hypothetical protein
MHFISVGLSTMDPDIQQFHAAFAVGFHVIDTTEPDSARGDWMGPLGGAVVRPLLQWSTQFTSSKDLEIVRPS